MDGRRWLFTKEQLANTPSRKCGTSDDQELSYRQQAANFIQEMGQRLNVNQLCINTAIVYLHRFYMFHSFEKFGLHAMSAAALFLSAKVEEQPRKLEHIIKVYHLLRTKERTLDVNSDVYLELAQELVINENILLQTLGFNVQVDHPHSHVVKTCQLVRASKELAQTSYYLATNSLHSTTLCLQYNPKVVAALCIHLACKWSNWELSPSIDGKDWWQYIDNTITADQLEELTREFLNVLEKMDPQLRQKMLSLRGSTTATASPSGSRGPSPAPSRTAGSCAPQHARSSGGDQSLSAALDGHQKQGNHVSYGESDVAGWADDFSGDFSRTEGKFAAAAASDLSAESTRTSSREHKERVRTAGAPSGVAPAAHLGTRTADARHGPEGGANSSDGSRSRGSGDSSVVRPKHEGGTDRQKMASVSHQPPAGGGSKQAQQPKAYKNHDGHPVAAAAAAPSLVAAEGHPKRPLSLSHPGGGSSTDADRSASHADASIKSRLPPGGSGSSHTADTHSKDVQPSHAHAAKPDSRHAKSGSHHSSAAAPMPHRHGSSGSGSGHQSSSYHGGHRPLSASAGAPAQQPSSSSSSRSHQAHHSAADRHGGGSSGGHAASSSGAEKHSSHHHRPVQPVAHQPQSMASDKHAGDLGRPSASAGGAEHAESSHRTGNGNAVASTSAAAAGSEVLARGHAAAVSYESHHRSHSSVAAHSASESSGSGVAPVTSQRSAAQIPSSAAEVGTKRVRSSDSASLSSPAKKQRSAELLLLQQPQLAAPSFLPGLAASAAQPSMPTLSSETIGIGDQLESHFSMPAFFMPPGLGREGPRFGENGAAALQVSSNGLSAAATFASLASSRTVGPPGSAAGAVAPVSYSGRGGHSLVASATSLQSSPSPHA